MSGVKPAKDYIVDPRKSDHLGLYKSGFRRFVSARRVRAIKEAFEQAPAAERVLEVGCGHGVILQNIYDPGKEFTAIDINESSVEIARQKFSGVENVSISTGDAYHLEHEDNRFDVVICSEVLEHLPDPERALKEIKRVLKPGGTFISTVPFEYYLIFLRAMIWPVRRLKGKWSIFVDEHLHYFTKRRYKSFLEKHFTVLKIERAEFCIRLFAVCAKE